VNKLILTAAIAAATIVPAIVSPQAATAMAMAPATMVCQATKAGETSNAVMGTTKLTCHTVDMEKVMAAEKSMMSMMPKTMTDAQMKQMKADQAVFNSAFMLPAVPGGLGQPDR
jgi:hypothetical protein